MNKDFFLQLKKVSYKIWLLIAIIVVGIFLRTYHFHAWLEFENDQVAEATLVRNVVQGHTAWPLLGPDMTGSGGPHSKIFHLGPIFYYFQIMSAQIFGTQPDTTVYPILFFSILSLPLFYLFVRRYFNQNISLSLTGLYAISSFSIQYSRFAWNPNIIPFFVLLFLLSLHELLVKKEQTHWMWILSLGIALGIGFQLHAILMGLLPATLFFAFVYLWLKNKTLWKKMAAVLCIAFILNVPQIISEFQANFSNTKIFLNNFTSHGSVGQDRKNSLRTMFVNAVDCHIEANTYMASSDGANACTLSYLALFRNNTVVSGVRLRTQELPNSKKILLLGLIFSILGYALFIHRCFSEKDESKKYFLHLIALYSILSFFVMTMIVNAGFVDFRYFIHIFFLPFLFLGFLAEYPIRKFARFYSFLIVLLFLAVALVNLQVIATNAHELTAKNRSNEHFVVLGEIEPMLQYIIANSDNQKEAQLTGDPRYLSNFSKALQYLAEEQNFTLLQTPRPDNIRLHIPLFYIEANVKNSSAEKENDYPIDSRQNFGQVSISKLVN